VAYGDADPVIGVDTNNYVVKQVSVQKVNLISTSSLYAKANAEGFDIGAQIFDFAISNVAFFNTIINHNKTTILDL
jgi:hypothetical protein